MASVALKFAKNDAFIFICVKAVKEKLVAIQFEFV